MNKRKDINIQKLKPIKTISSSYSYSLFYAQDKETKEIFLVNRINKNPTRNNNTSYTITIIYLQKITKKRLCSQKLY